MKNVSNNTFSVDPLTFLAKLKSILSTSWNQFQFFWGFFAVLADAFEAFQTSINLKDNHLKCYFFQTFLLLYFKFLIGNEP